MKKVRVNITLDQSIHEKATFFSKKEGKSLSENIELFLDNYAQQKLKGLISEPMSPYDATPPLQNSVVEIFNRLHPEQQTELVHYAEFLLTKNPNPPQRVSLFGLYKGKIFMSDDFDEPLEMFKEYMP
jgi:hypothetical protein